MNRKPPPSPPSAPRPRRAVTGALALCFALAGAASADVRLSPDQARALGVVRAPLKAAVGHSAAAAPGVFAPRPQAREIVAPPFAGLVARVMVLEGQAVRAGQPLAELVSREAAAAAADRSSAAAELKLAQAERARAARLVQEGIVAGSRLEQADARLQAARGVAASRSAAGAGASASGRYVLRAPFAGRVAQVQAEAGQGLQALEAAFVIDRDGPIQVRANLPAALAGKVRIGDPARVEGSDARVVAIGSVIDPKTRSISLRVETAARPGFIPGRSTVVEVLSPAGGLLDAPRSAVARVGGRSVVFAVAGETYRPVPVEVVSVAADRVQLRAPLKAGTAVAVAGVSELQSQAGK